jgi:hypothetical protein
MELKLMKKNLFKFIEVQKTPHFEYHLKSTRFGFIRKNLFTNTFYEYKNETFKDWLYKQNITNSASMEDTLLYSIVLRHLIKNKSCLFTYFDSKEEIERMGNDLTSHKCEWRYSIEYGRDSSDTVDLNFCKDFGFVNPEDFLNKVNYSNKDLQDRYFYLSKINESVIGNYSRIYHSDVTNWNFVFCTENNETKIKAFLCNENEQPDLSLFLQHCECMVNMQLGEDEGYIDYILILSKHSMEDKLNEIEQAIAQFIREYEALIDAFHSIDEEQRGVHFMQYFQVIFNKAIKFS